MSGTRATQWTKRVAEPLMQLRDEVWRALNDARQSDGDRPRLSWPDLVRGLRPDEENTRGVEARWSRQLNTDKLDVDTDCIGQALAALYVVRDRLPVGRTPAVRRMLFDEPEPAARVMDLFCPSCAGTQDLSGLSGIWRIIHQRSDNNGFLAWKVRITLPAEPAGSPGAWFQMETVIESGDNRTATSIKGLALCRERVVYLIGSDNADCLTIVSFKLPDGKSPGQKINFASGIIQRVGSKGPYAARAIARNIPENRECFSGSILPKMQLPDDLVDVGNDIAMLMKPNEELFLLAANIPQPGLE